MKKSLTYATIAFLLGVALMLTPFLMLPTRIEMDTQKEQLSPRNFSPENLQTLTARSESSAGVIPNYPMDTISIGLMLTFSLLFALIAFSRWKKRIA